MKNRLFLKKGLAQIILLSKSNPDWYVWNYIFDFFSKPNNKILSYYYSLL